MSPSRTAIRIVIPAYNEGKNLPSLCERIAAALKDFAGAYRLFIVNDGSRDNTQEVLAALKEHYPIEALLHEKNLGIATAFLTGMRAALEGAGADDTIVVIEGDGTSDPALIPAMVDALASDCDIVIASRYAPGGAYKNFPLKRLLLSRGANALLRLVCRLPAVRDYTIFFRAYRVAPLREALKAYGDRFTGSGEFACNAEILLRLRTYVRNVREIPLVYDYALRKGASSMRIGKNILSYISLFRIFLFEKKPPGSQIGRGLP